MNSNSMQVTLSSLLDRNGNIYHIGRVNFPGYIDCNDGVVFLIFLSEEGEETLHITTINNENTTYSQVTRRPDRIKIPLESRMDQNNKKFFLCKLQTKGFIDCRNPVTFLIYTSKEGSEELQIISNIIDERIKSERTYTSGVRNRMDVDIEYVKNKKEYY